MTDAEFLNAFELCTISESDWTHAAHIRMAFLYLGKFSWDRAVEKVRSGIKRYNASVGNHNGYHETVTLAYLKIIHDRRTHRDKETFPQFQSRNPDVFDRASPILLRYYQEETISSPLARREFVEPDILPLP